MSGKLPNGTINSKKDLVKGLRQKSVKKYILSGRTQKLQTSVITP